MPRKQLDYWDGRTPPPPDRQAQGQGLTGILSVWCFTLFAGFCVVAVTFDQFWTQPNVRWPGLQEVLGRGCIRLILIPLGVLFGIIGSASVTHRRTAAIIGLCLNGAVLLLFFARWL